MDLSPNDVGTIASFVVPGYLAIRAYSLVYTKTDKDFSKVLVESIAFSLPIVGMYNALWIHVLLKAHDDKTLYLTSVKYAAPLLLGSLVIGYSWARLRKSGYKRKSKFLTKAIKFLQLPSPSDDFYQEQFEKLKKDEYVTVTLRNGEIFSGVRAKISIYRKDEEQLVYFNYVAWSKKVNNSWDDRPGSLIIGMKDILYIETDRTLPD